jgi:hypothetical protein
MNGRMDARQAQGSQNEINATLAAVRGLGLGDGDKQLYFVLRSLADSPERTRVRTNKGHLADLAERSERRVSDRLDRLIDKGLVTVLDNERGRLVLYLEPIGIIESSGPRVRRSGPQKQLIPDVDGVREEQCSFKKASATGVPCQPSSTHAGPPRVAILLDVSADDSAAETSDLQSTDYTRRKPETFSDSRLPSTVADAPGDSGTRFADIRYPGLNTLSLKTQDIGSLIQGSALLQEACASGEERFVAKLVALLPSIQRACARKVARGLDAGWIGWDEAQRAIDYAHEKCVSDSPAELAGKAVATFKSLFRDKRQDWDKGQAWPSRPAQSSGQQGGAA